MKLFIRIKDGKPFEHPIFEDNFREAFPEVDTNNLPPEFARFERVPCPDNANKLEKNTVRYDWVNGVVKDVWDTEPLVGEERAQKLSMITEAQLNIFNELKAQTIQAIQETTGAEQQAWVAYQESLNAWTLIDPLRPKFPNLPRYLADGTFVTTDTSGSAPNVIE